VNHCNINSGKTIPDIEDPDTIKGKIYKLTTKCAKFHCKKKPFLHHARVKRQLTNWNKVWVTYIIDELLIPLIHEDLLKGGDKRTKTLIE
jgi:hypothetical protein